MPVLVVSDIHGSDRGRSLVENAIQRYCPDLVLSAGDQCPDMVHASFYANLVSVRGNCDRFYDYDSLPFPPLSREERIYGRRIVMTHGDRLWMDDFYLSPGDVFISGHTHVPELYKGQNGVFVLNPGSPSRPRSSAGPTAALLSPEGMKVFSLLTFKSIRSLAF